MDNIYWEISEIDKLIFELCNKAGLKPANCTFSARDGFSNYKSEYETDELIKYIGNKADIEVNFNELFYKNVENLLFAGKPLIIPVKNKRGTKFIGVLNRRGQNVVLLVPGLKIKSYPLKKIRDIVCRETERKFEGDIKQFLISCGIPNENIEKASSALLYEKLKNLQIGNYWSFNLPQNRKIIDHIKKENVISFFTGHFFSNILLYIIFVFSWSVIGKTAFSKEIVWSNFTNWFFLLILLVPANSAATWFQSITSIKLGSILKKRLLYGALKLDPEDIRHHGAGQLLGRVLESEAVETLALTGGFTGFQSVIELLFAVYLISIGTLAVWVSIALVCWFIFVLLLGRNYFLARKQWTKCRLSMSYDLTEKMCGQRTRIAQDDPAHYHDEENSALEEYLKKSKKMDRFGFLLIPLASRGWLLFGLIILILLALTINVSPELIAISLGGILLAQRGMKNFASGFQQLVGAFIAWNEIKLFYNKAIEKEPAESTLNPIEINDILKKKNDAVVLYADEINFRYKDKREFILNNCNLKIYEKDKLLLLGESGSGKSTLLSILSGIKESKSGKLTYRGIDFYSIGPDQWRKKIVNAPQFHDNHIFSATFLFNLLMGRRWPPLREDVLEAMNICKKLGLEELINRMPGGIFQMVGETGWQLSHGEKNRVYIARTLLHKAELVILDESFAALDSNVLMKVMKTVLSKAETLIVSAHP